MSSERDSPALWSACASPPKAIDEVRMARTEVSRELDQRVAPDENDKSCAPAWPESGRSELSK